MSFLELPEWARPGVLIEYVCSEGNWWLARVKHLTDEGVAIELSDGTLHNIDAASLSDPNLFRKATKIAVVVQREPLVNTLKVGIS